MKIKQTARSQSLLLYIASILVLIMGVILFFLARQTDIYFSWTIGVPLTAAFLGGGYLGSFALEFLSARERQWKDSRIAVPAVFLFTSLTFVITMLHLDKFHLDSTGITLRVTWSWIVVYAVVPVLMVIVFTLQQKVEGETVSSYPDPLTGWFRSVLLAQGLIMLFLGVLMLVIPATVAPLWPWNQTVLTAQAIGAWLVGIGTVCVHSWYENDWKSVRPALVGLFIFSMLQLINLIRFPDAAGLEWNSLNTILYLLFTVSLLFLGVYGLLRKE
ncbi:MAG: hypothetical protein ACXAE3_09310 [Candidatus Kariarchaeaceae archaeon]|jgi:predicted outer membrane lipoprotein